MSTARIFVMLSSMALLAIFAAACNLSAVDTEESEQTGIGIEGTLAAQSTRIVKLSTQVAQQEQDNESLWSAISYLSTLMPSALEMITPTPPESIPTSTAHNPTEPKESPTSMPSPSPVGGRVYPPAVRTGISEIDDVIDAILLGDVAARRDMVRFTTSACTTGDGLGGPPKCEPGEAEGTLVESFPVSSGEGVSVRPDNLDNTLSFSVQGLYAVYRVPEGAFERDYWPAGEYGIVFVSESENYLVLLTVYIESGWIVRLVYSYGDAAFTAVQVEAVELVLPPLD